MTLSLRQIDPVIYDDQGPALPSNRYLGNGWNRASNFGALYYNGTATWSNESGDSFSLTFNGTQITHAWFCAQDFDAVVNSGSQATLIGCANSIPTNSSLVAPSGLYYVDGTFGELLEGNSPQLAAYLLSRCSR